LTRVAALQRDVGRHRHERDAGGEGRTWGGRARDATTAAAVAAAAAAAAAVVGVVGVGQRAMP